MSIKRRRHQSLFYLVFIIFSGVFYIGMIGSGAFLESNNDVVSSPLNQATTNGDYSVSLLKRRLDKDKGEAQFTIEAVPTLTQFSETSFTFSTEFLGAEVNPTKVSVQQGDGYYFVVTVTHLPEKWQGMKLNVTAGREEKTQLVSYVLSHKKEGSSRLIVQSDTDIIKESITHDITLKETLLTEFNEAIDKQEAIQTANKEKISLLEADKKYQTEAEVNETNGQIKLLTEASVTAENEIASIKLEALEVTEKIKKLELKLADVGK